MSMDGATVASIGPGVCVLVGIGVEDTLEDAQWLGRKVLRLRLWDAWKASVVDLNHSILSVSQFTLMGKLQGNKPSFHRAMAPESSQELYDAFLSELRQGYRADRVQDGVFGAHMEVSITNDGPVTLCLDSKNR